MGSGRGLTTRGWTFLLGGLGAGVIALILEERDLLFVSFLTATLLLLAWAMSRVRVLRTRVQATYSITPPRLHVGEDAVLTLHLSNASRSTLRLDVRQDAVAHLFGSSRVLLPSLVPDALVDVSIPFTAKRRGAYQVDSPKVYEVDPLGLISTLRTLEATAQVLVLPGLVELDGLPRGLRGRVLSSGGVIASGAHADAGVRAYRNGDDPRTVHWRASARLEDDLVVRMSEPAGLERVRLVVDDRLRFTKDGDVERESRIALAASIGHHLASQGVDLTTVDLDGRVLASGRDVHDQLLVALASLPSGTHAGVRTHAGSVAAVRPEARARSGTHAGGPASTGGAASGPAMAGGSRRMQPVDAVIAVLGDPSGVDASVLGSGRLGRGLAIAFVATTRGANALQADGWRIVVPQGTPGLDAPANRARFVRAWQDGVGS